MGYYEDQRVAYKQSRRDEDSSTRCLLATFAYLGIPTSLVDVGCGPGHLVHISRAMGIEAYGLDLNYDGRDDYIHQWDLRDVRHLPGPRCDTVICWEVAEHIPAENADRLVTNIAIVLLRCGVLLFSAATPGQTGSGHVNEQPHGYWITKFTAAGLELDWNATTTLREMFSTVAPDAWWYGKNLLVFRKGDT